MQDFDKLWDYSQPELSEQRFRERLADCGASAGDSASEAYRLELLTQIARSQGLGRKFDEAHRTLDEVAADLTRFQDSLPVVVRVRYLLERGRVHNSSRQPQSARPLFLEAWQTAQAAGEAGFAIDAAHMLGIVDPPEEALHWNEHALALAESSADDDARRWLGSLYNNIGWTRHDRGEFQQALDLFQKALAFRQERGQDEETRIARWCVARALRSLGKTAEALSAQQDLLREYEAAGRPAGYVFEELGECHLALNAPEEAKKYFASAHAELSKDPWLNENEPERIARLLRLAS